MKKLAILLSLQVLVLGGAHGATTKECTLCVGGVAFGGLPPHGNFPSYVDDYRSTGVSFNEIASVDLRRMIVIAPLTVDLSHDALVQVDEQTKSLTAWAARRGPFYAFGTTVAGLPPDVAAYAVKQLGVHAQGLNVAQRIVLAPLPLDELAKLYDHGAGAYFDALVVKDVEVAAFAKWFAEHDPAKKIYGLAERRSPNVAYDLAKTLADGATLALLGGTDVNTDPADFTALGNFNTALGGDWAYDSTSKTTVLDAKGNRIEMPVITFVRGEDLRTIVVPRGDDKAPAIISLPGDRYTRPRIVDANGDRDVADVGKKGGSYLIGMQPVKTPFFFTVDHTEKPETTKEAVTVATQRGITVEEIIRNHQAYKSFQESVQPRYIAFNSTKLRFQLEGGEAIEAALQGDYFSEPRGRADWVWSEFLINGVKWKYGKIPELPLIQPEKVTQLPLDIHLTNEYRYQLVRETDVDGYHTYEVRFEPPPNAPATLPLYRGTVWIDSRTWARIRLTMVQLNLSGEVLSNEERIDFQPFALDSHAPLTAADVAKSDARSILWLPREVSAQQVISAAGRANVILRSTEFTHFRIDPADFDEALKTASASDARMIRETPQTGMRYLEKRANGERVPKEGFDTARTFILGGIHHDSGLDYPVVPLGGVDYFNFNLAGKGIQTNVFFAGLVLAANATQPSFLGTRTNVGVDFFGIALPTTSSIFRHGVEMKNEAVKSVPASMSLRVGHPFWQFGKIDATLGIVHRTYKRADDTAPNFIVPSDTFEISPSIDGQYSRWGYTATGFYSYTRRTSWKPWGNLDEYNPDQKTFTNFGGSLGKSFYLPKFQRIGVDINYLDGQRLDRFSKYELGFFGTQRVHGVRSGSVRAEKMILGHLTYGFVFSDQFRIEAFYDHALVDDKTAGYHREPFQGLGIAGQTVGPWGTLVRLDIGKTIGRNAQSGFVANVIFLKLF
jgi:hypothetical protein